MGGDSGDEFREDRQQHLQPGRRGQGRRDGRRRRGGGGGRSAGGGPGAGVPGEPGRRRRRRPPLQREEEEEEEEEEGSPGSGAPSRPGSRPIPARDGAAEGLPVLCQLGKHRDANRCLDKREDLAPNLPPPAAIPECPVCGKRFSSLKARGGHLKRCAARMEVPTTLLLQALRRQQQQQQEEPSSSSSSSLLQGRSLPSVPSQPKRKDVSSVQSLAKKPKTVPKRDRTDEDLLVAMAMSRSLLEKEKAAAKLLAKERKGRPKPPSSPPPLLLQNARELHRDMEERVGQLLSEVAEFPSTPRLPSSLLLESERFRRAAAGQPASPQGPGGSLWEFSSLTGPCLPGNFTATSLALPVPSQLRGTQESGVMLQDVRPFRSRDDGDPQGSVVKSQQEVPSASQQDAQALQALVELAGEGLTLTQWGLEVQQPEESGQEEDMASNFQTSCFSPGESRPSQRSRPRTALLDSLASAFREMVDNPHLSDLQFQVDSGEILYAHMFVLYARCPLLMEAVDRMGFMVAEEGGAWTRRMLLDAVPREAVYVLLSYLYTANASVPPQVLSDVAALATRFGVTELAAVCEGGQPGLMPSRKERESDVGGEEGREKVLEELLESMWLEEDHEEQAKGAWPEEAVSDNMSDRDLEEIYEFAATQIRLAQGPTGEGSRPGSMSIHSVQGEKNSLEEEEGGAGWTPHSQLASSREVGRGDPLGLGLQQETEEGRGPFLAATEPSQEEDDCLLVREGCSSPCPQGPGAQELSPGIRGSGSTGAQPPSLQQEWALLPREGARELPELAFPIQSSTPSLSPARGAARARDSPEASPPSPATSLLPTWAGKDTSPPSKSSQEHLGREVPSCGPEQPPGPPESLLGGANLPDEVVVLDSEEEEEAKEAEPMGPSKLWGSSDPLASPVGLGWTPEHPSKWKVCPGAGSSVGQGSPLHLLSPKEQARGPPEVFGETGGSLGKRRAVWGLSSDEEDPSMDEGLLLVPDTPGPSQRRPARTSSSSGPEAPWSPEGQGCPPRALIPCSPLEPPAREGPPWAPLLSCGPGSRRSHASPGATEEAEASVVVLEDSDEEKTEEVPEAAALCLDKDSSLPTKPVGAASGGTGMLSPVSEVWGCSPLAEGNQTGSSEEEAQGWLAEDSDSSDILPLGQRVVSSPAGTPPRALDPACQAREEPGRTAPQTPMPSYSTMVTPELKKELRRFGVRALPKRQMVLKLREIFQFTHRRQGAEETAASWAPEAVPHQRAKALVPSTFPKQVTGSAQPPHLSRAALFSLGSREDPSLGGKASAGLCSLQDGSEAPSFSAAGCPHGSSAKDSRASRAAPQGPAPPLARGSEPPVASQSSSSVECEAECLPASQASGLGTDKLEALQRYIRSTPALCRRLLLYQPIELAGLQAELKEKGIRVALGRLLDFLDAHCITFTTAEARREKRTPRKGRRRC